MSTLVLDRQPAPLEPAPALTAGTAQHHRLRPGGISLPPARFGRSATQAQSPSPLAGQLLAASAEALFTSHLSARREYTAIEVAAAIRHAISTHGGIRGCAGEVAAAYGEDPETAARRMRWARAVSEASMGQLAGPGLST
jgi:hypothetical protein